MNMTPEEKVNQETWYVLQKLREKSLVSTITHTIIMKPTHIIGGDFPSDRRVKEILLKLRELEAIKIVNNRDEYGNKETNWLIELKLKYPKFDELYNLYEAKYKPIPQQITAAPELPDAFVNFNPRNGINNLERRFNSFKDLPEKGFYLGIADYIKYIIETSALDSIAMIIIEDREQDKSQLKQLKEKVMNDATQKAAVKVSFFRHMN
ncbi:MAG: hypothetical protein KatS3mg087_0288 [Patescibacteria group bacterium]|nr:MAG: hypothetical protein KatS3mg087_0288 [Patescibacteria group bacterium]